MSKGIVITLSVNTMLLVGLLEAQASHHPSRVLVQFESSANQAARSSAHKDAGAIQVLEEYESFEGLQLVEVQEGEVEEAVKAYLGNPVVISAEPDYERYPDTVCNSNDPYLVTATPDPLWGIKKVRAPEAWCLTTGSATFPVAVIDSGIRYNHPDLQNNIWTNAAECPGGFGACVANGIDEDGNQKIDDFYGWDFKDPPDNDPVDEGDIADYHGTHMAGTIAGVGNNSTGIVGMNWQAKLVALKIYGPSGQNQTYASRAIAALNYCVQKNIKVSNNSYGGPDFSVSECAAIQSAGNAIGHIFVTSAGNQNQNLDSNPKYPASCGKSQSGCAVCPVTNIITVTATDPSDNRVCVFYLVPNQCALYVNTGANTVHLAAPCTGIYSTVYSGNPPSPSYAYKGATSTAAPHVTGAVALVWSRYPTWTYTQVRNLILNTVHKGVMTGQTATGGRLDIGAALLDCNDNDVADGIDVNTFASLDCNHNHVPDECDGLGGCCLPEGGGECCVRELDCWELGGWWDPGVNCLECAMFAPPDP